MDKKFSYKALILARESRGLTQLALSKDTGISQHIISRIEHDNFVVDTDMVNVFSEVLRYPPSFFYQDVTIYPANLHYRRKASVSAKIKGIVEATMNIYRLNIQTLMQSLELPGSNIPYINESRYTNPIDVAIYVRQYWNISKGRIENIVKILEDKGIIIVPCNFYTDEIDGRSMKTESGSIIIFINKSMPMDRQRYTLAHELGHIIMHLYSSPTFDVDVEQEANLFASEFLMPQEEIKLQLSGSKLTIAKLADLKRFWKTSMQSILKWSEILHVTKPNQARYLWSQFNTMGIKINEPIEIPKETPTLLSEIINAFYENLEYSKSELAALLCLTEDEFEEKYISKIPFKILR